MIKRAGIAASMFLVVTGCGGPSLSDNQKAEVRNIAKDFADAASSDATAGVDLSTIERRIERLEKGNARAISADKVELDSLSSHAEQIETIRTKTNDLIKHYNDHLNRFHGGG